MNYYPRPGEVCWLDGKMVYIHSGCFLDPVYGRVSNFWEWSEVFSDGSLGEKQNGYGGKFRRLDKIYKTKIFVELLDAAFTPSTTAG